MLINIDWTFDECCTPPFDHNVEKYFKYQWCFYSLLLQCKHGSHTQQETRELNIQCWRYVYKNAGGKVLRKTRKHKESEVKNRKMRNKKWLSKACNEQI